MDLKEQLEAGADAFAKKRIRKGFMVMPYGKIIFHIRRFMWRLQLSCQNPERRGTSNLGDHAMYLHSNICIERLVLRLATMGPV